MSEEDKKAGPAPSPVKDSGQSREGALSKATAAPAEKSEQRSDDSRPSKAKSGATKTAEKVETPEGRSGAQSGRGRHRGDQGRNEKDRGARDKGADLFQELVMVSRVTKVVKGGKNFSFSALAVVGDREGSAGFGKGKAKDVSKAARKAMERATKAMGRIPLKRGRTLHHDIKCRSGAALVQLRAAPPGTGVIAGGAMRAVFEAFGVQDVVSKSLKGGNPHNVVHATFKALQSITPPKLVAQRRGLKIGDLRARPQANRSLSSDASALEAKA